MPRRAWNYIGFVFITGTLLSVWATMTVTLADLSAQWYILATLAVAATLAQLFKVEAPDHQLYHTTLLFLFAGVILLHPFLFAFLVLIPHLIEWTRERIIDSPHLRDWYLQPFNIFVHVIAGITARGVYLGLDSTFSNLGNIALPLAAVASASVYVILNHLLVGLAIGFARGISLRESGILEPSNLITDLVTLLMGYAVAALWQINFWLVWIAVSPLVLIYRAFSIPTLERQAQVDSKTEVWNAGYFNKAIHDELTRAQELDRPLSLVMADLDLLRDINNTYGHLAGDVVLQGVAQILRESAQMYDIVARFGGEEFAILMPETMPQQAWERIEVMRKAIESAEFVADANGTPIKATMSFGIAARQGNEQTTTEFIHCADVALYQAKDNGRNRSYVYHYQRDRHLRIPNSAAMPNKTELNGNHKGPPLNPVATDEHPVNQPVSPKPPASRPKPFLDIGQLTNIYIGGVALIAVILAIALVRFEPNLDWIGLGAFVALALLVEALSIEIYLKDTTVSTSAAPYIASILLFGPVAALFTAPLIAFVVFIKRGSPLKRVIFNASNHAISGLICAGLIMLIPDSLTSLPTTIQILVSLATAWFIYIITTGLLAGAVSLDSNQSFYPIWKERFRWLSPYYLALGFVGYALIFSYNSARFLGILVVLVPLLMLRFSQKQYIDHTEGLVKQLRANNRELRNQAEEITLLNEELLLTLARSIDLRDPYVMEHSKNVARYAVFTAQELGLPPERLEHIRKAGLLHDIGKLGIPEVILFKPSKLDNEEYEMVKAHVTIGADLIYGCHSLRMLIPFVKHHHERFDGRGYPNGLAAQAIPLEARILCLADAVEAMASDRPYKMALDPDTILSEINRCAGTQFDPDVVDAFCRVIEKHGDSVIINSARDVQARGYSIVGESGQWP